jgi:hypothetical protein
MGQYYKLCNLDKKEYISPLDFGAGLKLMEFACPSNPSMVTSALVILLADGNNRGGGDLRSDNPVIGSWKNNRIVVCGDYADERPELDNFNVYQVARPEYGWKNISLHILNAMMDNGPTAYNYGQFLSENYSKEYWMSPLVIALAHAHKDKQYGINRWENLALLAEDFFLKLFPQRDTLYYKTINGISKHASLDITYNNELSEQAYVILFANSILEKADAELVREEKEKEDLLNSINLKLDKIIEHYNKKEQV